VNIAVTGTPGTGKTTATEQVETDLSVVHLNEVIKDDELTTGRDTDRDSLVTDMEAVAEWLTQRDDILFESHLAHNFDADRVIVLRCHPKEIEDRLENRGESEESIAENAESEAIDVILSEVVNRHGEGNVYEIETTNQSPVAVATEIEAVIEGQREPSAGTVSYVEYL